MLNLLLLLLKPEVSPRFQRGLVLNLFHASTVAWQQQNDKTPLAGRKSEKAPSGSMSQLWELSQRVEAALADLEATDLRAVNPDSVLSKVSALAGAANEAAEQAQGPERDIVRDAVARRLPAIVSRLAGNSDLANATAAACDVVAQALLSAQSPPSLEAAAQIKKAGLGLLVSAKAAKAKIAGCSLAKVCFERSAGVSGMAAAVDVPQCLKLLLSVLSQGSK
jgi:hypothetical protein